MFIRPCTNDDYPAVVSILQNYRSSYTLNEMRHENDHRDPKCKHQEWIAELDGHVVGYAIFDQPTHMYHPRKFVIAVFVHPFFAYQGIDAKLYDCLLTAMLVFDPLSVQTMIQENRTHCIDLLKTKGFQEAQRENWLELNVIEFNLTSHTGIEEKLLTEGIEIKTFKELESDLNRNYKLHKLENELNQDVPYPEPATALDYKYFFENRLNNHSFIPEANFVAIHESDYVGLSYLEMRPDHLFTILTAVKRTYRHMGIARALKLREIAYAKSQECLTIRTANNLNNRPMLGLNESLGFVTYQTVITLEMVFH